MEIDYQANAVKASIADKYGRDADLQGLSAVSTDRIIVLRDGARQGAGSRDDLLAAVRAAATYDELWEKLGGIFRAEK